MLIYKIIPRSLWRAAERRGFFEGAAIDLADGYIHFSTAAQLRETAAKHFAGQTDLVVLTVDSELCESDLRWEPSRGGDLFPHLYAPLAVDHVSAVHDLPWRDGVHDFGVIVA